MTVIEHPVAAETRSPLRRWILGDRPWGRLETRVLDRSGTYVQRLLVVYPPGTDDRERLALWSARTWPWAGAVAGIAALMLFGDLLPGAVILPLVGAIYLAGIVVSLRAAGPVRKRVRRMTVTVARDPWLPDDADADAETMRRIVSCFAELDRRAAAGLVDPVHYETTWSRLYTALDTELARR